MITKRQYKRKPTASLHQKITASTPTPRVPTQRDDIEYAISDYLTSMDKKNSTIISLMVQKAF